VLAISNVGVSTKEHGRYQTLRW